MTKVDVFLIGAAKAGTTALSELLAHHEDIAPMAIKEPGHFCKDIHEINFSPSYERMLDWNEDMYFSTSKLLKRHIGFVTSPTNYSRLQDQALSSGSASHVLDASTAYLYSETAAEEVFHYNPAAQIIVILRNPVTRAYSHYNMARKYGKEKRTFFKAIQDESILDRALWGIDECYLELGDYQQQLQRWTALFPKEQILVLFHEDLLTQPQNTMDLVCEFLEIPIKKLTEVSKANTAEVPRSRLVSALLQGSLSTYIATILPSTLKKRVKLLILKKPESIDDASRTFLVHYFASANQALEKALNSSLKHWK
jgi:hypothetical protein